jgi:hypothetical protein
MAINKQLNNQGRFVIEVTDLKHATVTDSTNGKVYDCEVSVHVRKDFYEQYVDTTKVDGCTNKGRYTVKRKLHPTFNETTKRYELRKDDVHVVEHSDLTGKTSLGSIFDLI